MTESLLKPAGEFDAVCYFTCGFGTVNFCGLEKYFSLELFTEDLDRSLLNSAAGTVHDDAVFENGIDKGVIEKMAEHLIMKMTQHPIITFRRNLNQYLHQTRLAGRAEKANDVFEG
jgi:hypothetical protein